MENIKNIEVIQINTIKGVLTATISYQDLSKIGNINQGYQIIDVPVNIRDYKKSSRDNILVNQSINEETCKRCKGTGLIHFGGSFGGSVQVTNCACQ